LDCVQVARAIPVNFIMFLPAILLGVIGGVLGSMFTIVNVKIARLRRRLMAKIKGARRQQIIRIAEPVVIMVSASMSLPRIQSCCVSFHVDD